MYDGSFTSEPQYQRPDNRVSDIGFEPKPPMIIPQFPATAGVNTVHHRLAPDMFKLLLNRLANGYWLCNRLDFYGNSLILGALCNALAFITYGFYRCKVYKVNDTFLWSVVLLFGGIGQITAGILEFLKCRSFPSIVYTTLGFYCLSHYAFYVIPKHMDLWQNQTLIYPLESGSICAFYSAWVVICFALVVGSARSNLLYLLQLAFCLLFFLLRAVGEGTDSLGTKRNAAGILEVISGFFSLYIGITQILNNETFYYNCLPTCPLCPDNEIDVYGPIPTTVTPVVTAPVVAPVAATPVVPVTPVAATPVVPVTPVAATPVVQLLQWQLPLLLLRQ